MTDPLVEFVVACGGVSREAGVVLVRGREPGLVRRAGASCGRARVAGVKAMPPPVPGFFENTRAEEEEEEEAREEEEEGDDGRRGVRGVAGSTAERPIANGLKTRPSTKALT